MTINRYGDKVIAFESADGYSIQATICFGYEGDEDLPFGIEESISIEDLVVTDDNGDEITNTLSFQQRSDIYLQIVEEYHDQA